MRFKLPRFNRGLETLADPLIADMGFSPACSDVDFSTGLLRGRTGFRRLANEPSYRSNAAQDAKSRTLRTFTEGSTETATATFTRTLGTQWTVHGEVGFANSDNVAAGNRVLLVISATTNDPLKVTAIGDGTDVYLEVVIKDKDGTSVTLTSAARTVAEWEATGTGRLLRIVRDGSTCYLYVQEVLEDSDTLTAIPHEQSDNIYLAFDGSGSYSTLALGGLTITNRVLAEDEIYWGLNWPMDPNPEADILGSWPCNEGSGTTLKDYSVYGNNFTCSSTSWNGGEQAPFARGLGMYTHRNPDGRRTHILAASRRGTDSTGAAPSGALTIWQKQDDFYPYFWGGDPYAFDETPTLDGLDYLSRWTFASALSKAYMMNGVDSARKYDSSTGNLRYMGITAPAAAPYCGFTATGSFADGVYKYAYSYYNKLEGVESAVSPVTELTVSGGAGASSLSAICFYSDDPQVDTIRVYRSKVGGTVLYLTKELTNSATLATVTLADTLSDASLISQTIMPGSDVTGNWERKRQYFARGPVTAPTLVGTSAGITGTFYYAYSWYDSSTGDETGLSPVSTITVSNKTVSISTLDIPSAATKYDKTRIYRCPNGSSLFKLVVEQNSQSAVSSDTTADASLTTVTWSTRCLVPLSTGPVVFANRVWIYSGSTIYWSSAGDYENFPWGNSHVPSPGANITGIVGAEGALYASFDDERVFLLPHPGDEYDLSLFVPLNMREWSSKGGAVSHQSIAMTPYGLVWLGRDGFYRVGGGAIELLSPSITPDFINMNRVRSRFACGMYLDDRQMYICWLSRGNKRLNEEAFVFDFRAGTWTTWNIHADACGVLEDAKGVKHYCFMTELGYLSELVTDSYKDGDGTGTLNDAISVGSCISFADISHTEPAGGAGGYPVYFRDPTNLTVYQRWMLDDSLGIGTGTAFFYPSLVALTSNSWNVHYHGIKPVWTTMKTDLGDARPDKTVQRLFVTHGLETAGSVKVEYSVDDGTFATADGSPVALTDNMTSQVSIQVAGRYAQLRFTHDPPRAAEPLKIVEVEVEFEPGGDTA